MRQHMQLPYTGPDGRCSLDSCHALSLRTEEQGSLLEGVLAEGRQHRVDLPPDDVRD